MQIFDDLEAELDRLDAILDDLSPKDWTAASAAAGWTVADVVLHLAQTDEFVVASAGADERLDRARLADRGVDAAMDELVEHDRAVSYAEILQRWRAARTAALDALRAADPGEPLQWVAAPLKPATLATTRLAEHWAHGLDITGPLGIRYDDTDRLRHVAWLAHRTLPYAFSTALPGRPVPTVYAELAAPSGATWRLGDPGADVVVTGAGGAWCRLGAQRTTPALSGLTAVGEGAEDVLRVVRNYAA